jgi:multiple sugar transport system permease protein
MAAQNLPTPRVAARPAAAPLFSENGLGVAILKYAVLFALAFLFMLPLLWMVTSAFKNDDQVYRVPPVWLPSPIFPENFPTAWSKFPFTQFAFNTVFRYALPATFLATFSSAIVAYGFSRLRWKGRDVLFGLCLATVMIPAQVMLVPLFITYKNLGWLNSYLPLVVPALFGSLFRIILPLSVPPLIVVALFSFLGAWNDFLQPLVYINKQEMFPLALGVGLLRRALGETGTTAQVYPHLMAVSTIITIPIIILYFLAQRRFIEGIATTGMKG